MRFKRVALLGALATSQLCTISAAAAASAVQAQTNASGLTARANGFDLHGDSLTMRVTALTNHIVRVQIGRNGAMPEDASWAVLKQVRAGSVPVKPSVDGFSTAALRVRVNQATMQLVVEDLAGKPIAVDASRPIDLQGSAFTLRKSLRQGERIFGMGDKTGGSLDRREQSYVNWNTDAYGFSSGTDPIYKSIPFFIGVDGSGGSYGLLLDNSWRSWFDFGHRDPGTIAMGAPDGPIDYYVIAGPALPDVVRRYTDLTGKAPMPPQWALGFQQSRYSYMTDQEVRGIADRLRSDRIPTDVIWLDIDFQDRNRPFTVNTKTFPNLRGLTSDLRKQGIRVVAITDLHVARAPNEGYVPYDTGVAGDHFVRNADGSVYVAPVWPGPSVFPDFTRAETRRWWGGLHRGMLDAGIAGIWNDMNEPAVFETPTKTMPLNVLHRIATDDFFPREATHAEIHNVYGQENVRATYEGLKRLQPNERPFVMTRATYAGGHRYAVTWTGDNNSSWDHLRLSVHQLINLGLSGFSYAAADIGGFTGGPSPELLTRWFQIGAFTPVFRAHAAKDTPRAEPWVDGPEHLAIRRRYIEERYRLMPYLYGLAANNARTGDPIMRPVFYDYPAAMNAPCDQSMAFTVGAQLLVAPSPRPESPQPYRVCLPAGGWYDYWSGQPAATATAGQQAIQSATQAAFGARVGDAVVTETPRLDRLPLFVRAGTILPRQSLVQSTSDKPQGPLELHLYPGEDCRGELYADDGHSMSFERGDYVRQLVRCSAGPDGIRIDFGRREGRGKPWWDRIEMIIHNWQGPARVIDRGRPVPARSNAAATTLAFSIADKPQPATIVVGK